MKNNKTIKQKNKIEYEMLLKSGMFWEFYPKLTGDYEKDKTEWKKIYKQLIKTN